jgi:hypothetical protein
VKGWANYLVNCPRCVSVWAGAAILAGQHIRPVRPLIKALALSQAALVVVDTADYFDRKL